MSKTKKNLPEAVSPTETPKTTQYFALTLEQARTISNYFMKRVVTEEGLPFIQMLNSLPTIDVTEKKEGDVPAV